MLVGMGKMPRIALGNMVYHVLNRANGKLKIFNKEKDYEAFENILREAKEKHSMRILSYCIMPNHWHLVLYPDRDGILPLFMHWLTLTHTQRYRVHYKSVGFGHLYQGTYKSFPVQTDEYFLRLCRYVERNPLRAKLVKRAEDWRWSSAWVREKGSSEQQNILSSWPVEPYEDYRRWLNATLPHEESQLGDIRLSVTRGKPHGDTSWVLMTAKKMGLESTLNSRGRPTKR